MVATSDIVTVLIFASATIVAAFVLWVARAVVKLLQNRQTEARDRDSFSEFMLGKPAGKSGVPGSEGWISKVDKTLATLTAGQARTELAVTQILREVKDDNNGDHNLRGIVKRGAEAAGAEVVRVRRNEDEANEAS